MEKSNCKDCKRCACGKYETCPDMYDTLEEAVKAHREMEEQEGMSLEELEEELSLIEG